MSSRKSCILINLANVHDNESSSTSNDYSIREEATTTSLAAAGSYYSPLASPSNRLSFANPGLVFKSLHQDYYLPNTTSTAATSTATADSSISSSTTSSSSSSRITPIGQKKPSSKKHQQKDEMIMSKKNHFSQQQQPQQRKSTSLEFLNDSLSTSGPHHHHHHLYYALNPANTTSTTSNSIFSTSMTMSSAATAANQSQLNSSGGGVPTVNSSRVSVGKEPRPQRCLLILESVISGLTSTIGDVRCKVADLSAAVANGYNAMTKQLLQSECYLRHLEQRVGILSKLQKSYTVYLKMREGIQNMYDAYKSSPGNQIKNLANIKSGWRECLKTLCLIEAQIESLLGTFQFQIEKLIGFSRLCPGDTYEIQIKYGADVGASMASSGSNSNQTKGRGCKIKARARIGKDAVSQTWNRDSFALKITLDELIQLKINEIKFLGKNVLVGEQVCDTKDFFSTLQTQRLTVNANTSGTIKMSMLITWLPFENCQDSLVYFNPTSQYLPASTLLRQQSNLNDVTANGGSTRPMSMMIMTEESSKSSSSSSSSSSSTHENRSLCLSVSSSSSGSSPSNDDEFLKETTVQEIIDELVNHVTSVKESHHTSLVNYSQLRSVYNELVSLLDKRDVVLRGKLSTSVDRYLAATNTTGDNLNDSRVSSSLDLEDEVLKCFEFLNDEESTHNENGDDSIIVESESARDTDLDLFLAVHFKYCIDLLKKLSRLEQRSLSKHESSSSLIINKANYEPMLSRLDQEINFINLYIDQGERKEKRAEFVNSIIGDNTVKKEMWLKLTGSVSLLCCTDVSLAIKLLAEHYSDSGGSGSDMATFISKLLKNVHVLTLPHFVHVIDQLDSMSSQKLCTESSLYRLLCTDSDQHGQQEDLVAQLAELFLLKSECYVSFVEPLVDQLVQMDVSALADEREKLLFYHNFGKLIQSEEVRGKLRSAVINQLVETENDSLWDQHFEQLLNIF